MPCYEVNTASVKFSANHYGLLSKAVDSLGGILQRNGGKATAVIGGQTITFENGQATGNEVLINQVRVAYSQTIVKLAQQRATQNGWLVQQVTPNLATIQVRGK